MSPEFGKCLVNGLFHLYTYEWYKKRVNNPLIITITFNPKFLSGTSIRRTTRFHQTLTMVSKSPIPELFPFQMAIHMAYKWGWS